MSHNADCMCAIIKLIENTLDGQFKDALFQSSRASKTAQTTMVRHLLIYTNSIINAFLDGFESYRTKCRLRVEVERRH